MKKILVMVLGLACASQAFSEVHELPVPSDPHARYFLVERGGTSQNPELVTQRMGPSGVSYSHRVFDCGNQTSKYLGTGDTLEEARKSRPGPSMAPLVRGSIAWYMWVYACTGA